MSISVDILDKFWPDTPKSLLLWDTMVWLYIKQFLKTVIPFNTRLDLKEDEILLHWEGLLMRKKLMPKN